MLRLSGDQIEMLTRLTGEYFDVASLRIFIRFKCDRNLEDIDSFQNKESGIFQLFVTAEKQGWLLPLVKALADKRPDDADLHRLAAEIAAPPVAAAPVVAAPTFMSPTTFADMSAADAATGNPVPAALSGRQAALLGDWYGAQMQGEGPGDAPISYPLRLQVRSVASEIRGIFRFTLRKDDKVLDESIDFDAALIQDRFVRIWYCDDKSGKVQLGTLFLRLSDDGSELTGYDVGYGYSSGRIATARTILRKQSIIIDPNLDLMQQGSFPDQWATRAAFLHPKGGSSWRGRAVRLETENPVIDAYVSLLEPAGDWDVMMSCGPGDGQVDAKITAALKSRVKRYVPVDISQSSCKAVVASIASVCPVPIGIVGDLEDGFDFIRGALQQCAPGRLLVLCTGNVIGNLDMGERRLIRQLSDLMQKGNSLLLSAATGVFPDPVDRVTFDAHVDWIDLRDLIVGCIVNLTGENGDAIDQMLDTRVGVRAGPSDVPGASVRQLFDQQSQKAVLVLRRYQPAKLAEWIERLFPLKVVKAAQTPTSDADVGISTILLERL